MNKEKFEKPVLKVVKLDEEIILTSGGTQPSCDTKSNS